MKKQKIGAENENGIWSTSSDLNDKNGINIIIKNLTNMQVRYARLRQSHDCAGHNRQHQARTN